MRRTASGSSSVEPQVLDDGGGVRAERLEKREKRAVRRELVIRRHVSRYSLQQLLLRRDLRGHLSAGEYLVQRGFIEGEQVLTGCIVVTIASSFVPKP